MASSSTNKKKRTTKPWRRVPRVNIESLNTPQREAVTTLSGPLLVLAGAGTGKTRVVTFRIANLIAHGTRPERILAVTFTNKASREMQERASALLGGGKKEAKPQISTFHSLCVKILRRHIEKLGYPTTFAIYARNDQEGVARDALRQVRIATAKLKPGDLLSTISRWKSTGVRPEQAAQVAETDVEHLASVAFRRYQAGLKAAGAVDFDDLLVLTEQLFTEHADVRREEAGRFDHLLVDEYQDTNGSQYRIVKAIAGAHRNLCVVGDDDQSIYGWRGAEVEHILRFKVDWPEAVVVRLEQNYRSTGPILETANTLIAYNANRHDKVLRAVSERGAVPGIHQAQDEEAESEFVVGDISRLLGTGEFKPSHFAILFRTNEQPRAFEQALRKAKLPYVLVGGMSFYDRREVRDLFSYLRVMVEPRDDPALLRIINVPARGIGQGTAQKLMAAAVERGLTVWEAMDNNEVLALLSRPAEKAIREFREMIEPFKQRYENREEEPLAKVTQSLLAKIGYQDELMRLYEEPLEQETRWNSVEQVVNGMAAFETKNKQGSLREYLDDAALSGPDDASDKDSKLERDAIMLMTLHSAKGLEFRHVYLVGMEEGFLPHHRSISSGDDASIDEERRLCYVGITRAERRLTFTLALSRRKWGREKTSIPSRFLYECTGKSDARPASGRKPKAAGSPRPQSPDPRKGPKRRTPRSGD